MGSPPVIWENWKVWRSEHIATYEQFRPTLLNSLNCLKVYRVFKGTRWSVRCAQTCEVRLVRSRRHLHMHIATYEKFRPTLLNSLDCLKVYRVFKDTCWSVRCAQTCEVRMLEWPQPEDQVEHCWTLRLPQAPILILVPLLFSLL